MNAVGAGFLYLLMSIGYRVDVLILSYGGNGEYPIAVLCRGGVTVVLVRWQQGANEGDHRQPPHTAPQAGNSKARCCKLNPAPDTEALPSPCS